VQHSVVLLGVLLAVSRWLVEAPSRPGTPGRETIEPAGVQTVYRAGVPHTDAQGDRRWRVDDASFFPRCLYHAMPGSLGVIRAAGFNCVHAWEGAGLGDIIGELRVTGLQLIKHWPSDDEIRRFRSDPRVLGWYLDEEPTGQTRVDMDRGGDRGLMAARFRAFEARMVAIKQLDPRHPVFPIDGADIPPGELEWWDRWNRAGDVSVHDNYPLRPWTDDLEGLAASVTRAVHLVGERKPVWITLQAFGGLPGLEPPGRMPTPNELRGMAFAAIVHGATGIILFAWDSRVTREGGVLGIAPDAPDRLASGASVRPVDAARSRALWAGATALNAELARLTPWLLSPTSRVDYQVSVSGAHRTASPIRTILKQRGDEYTLLAVNLEGRPVGTGFRFPLPIASVRRLNPDGSVTPLVTDGRTVRDHLDSYGAAVYRLTFR
jgi:hypothetical protein